MNEIEFQFWSRAFLAAMQGAMGIPSYIDGAAGSEDSVIAENAAWHADAALAVWREKRREMHMPEVKND